MIQKEITVFCDGADCNAFDYADGNKLAAGARRFLRRFGWTRVIYPDGKVRDYCPTCSKKQKETS